VWHVIAQIALIAFLVIGSATLVVAYAVRRRRGIEPWPQGPALYSDLEGPKLPPPEWVDWPENDSGPTDPVQRG